MSKYLVLSALLVLPVLASAHVVVRPSEAGIAAYQTFNVSVPTEKDIPTVGVRLLIPEGLASVRPNVKPGWNVEILRSGEGESARVTELIWTGGSIPADQRDDFFFSARTPASSGELIWKAYQTYSDGSIVAWDAAEEHDESGSAGEDGDAPGPYSTTMVVNDLSGADTHGEEAEMEESAATRVAERAQQGVNDRFWWDCLTIIALIMSATALALSMQNPSRKANIIV